MATSGGSESPPGSAAVKAYLDELLLCHVCLEAYNDPKTLQCLHSFCNECLEKCRRPYRRDIICPVCKKVTNLPTVGVQGLTYDFRIQQIRDLIRTQNSSPPLPVEGACGGEVSPRKESYFCNVCESKRKDMPAAHYCFQCYVFLCPPCHDSHQINPLFKSHHLLDLSKEQKVFCSQHHRYPIQYFCRDCAEMLCTICAMSHNQEHLPVTLSRGVVEGHQKELKEALTQVTNRLMELSGRIKWMETVKEVHQKALYVAQHAVKERTRNIVQAARRQETELLQQAERITNQTFRDNAIDQLAVLNFHKNAIKLLQSDVTAVLQGSPEQCLTKFSKLMERAKKVFNVMLPNIKSKSTDQVVRFSTDDSSIPTLGKIIEARVNLNEDDSKPSTRISSILQALSPTKREGKSGKIKNYSRNTSNCISSMADTFSESPKSPDQIVRSPPRSPGHINLTELLEEAETSCNEQEELSVYIYVSRPSLIFSMEEVGGWPGRILAPSGVRFLPNGSIVVAECDNRLQVFDRQGHSLSLIGWGKIQPQSVVVTANNLLAVTDRRDKCLKIFGMDGEQHSSFGVGHFTLPCGLAITKSGRFIVTDTEKHSVSVLNQDGSLVTNFGSWGSGDYEFNSPVHVATNIREDIIISDDGNRKIKIYDKVGKLLQQFQFMTCNDGDARRPGAICVDSLGNLLVTDKEAHKVSLLSPQGRFVQTVLSRANKIRYPCGLDMQDDQLAVIESHVGLLDKEPHHSLKVFNLKTLSQN